MTTTLEKSQILPAGPKAKFPGATLITFRRNPLDFLQKLQKEYGDISYFRLGPVNMCFINNPDYIKDVLVTNHRNFHKGRALQRAKKLLGEGLLTSEDAFHLRQRRLSQPAFHRQRIGAYAQIMTDYAQKTAESWQDGETRDILHEMMKLTLSIVGKTLFDADVAGEAEEIGQALTEAMEMFNLITVPWSGIMERLPLPSTRRFQKARQRLDETIFRMIKARRESGEDRGDLLSMLLMAQDTEGDGSVMSNEQLRDEAMTIFLAGHETTANALTWTWYLLSQHPAVEAKLHAELDQVLGGRIPTLEDLPSLRYTEMVLSESMRLYPPAWIMGRRALNDYSIGNYYLPKDTIVLLSQYVMHRNPKYFPEPDQFNPERWTPEAKAALPKFAYFPFGGGPRLCIGEPFAWMEGELLLATLAQKWKLRLVPGHPVELQPLITLRPKHGMKMTLEAR